MCFKHVISKKFQIPLPNTTNKYLGLPIYDGKMTNQTFGLSVQDKLRSMQNKLENWQQKFLNKSVLATTPFYSFHTFPFQNIY